MRAPSRLVVALGLLLVLGGCARAGGEAFQPTLNTPLALPSDTAIGQTFNPAGDAVQAVELQVATYAAPADPDGVLTVELRDPVDGSVLDTAQVAGADMGDSTWVRASFDTPVAVPDVVLAEATWRGATPLALWANVPLEGADRSSVVNDPYADGQLVRDGRPTEGDLSFRVLGAGGAGAGTSQVVEIARSAGARLADQPLFTAVWLLALVGALALAVVGLRRPRA